MRRRHRHPYVPSRWLLLGLGLLPLLAHSEESPPAALEQIEVTATRAPTPIEQVPDYITVVRGSELRARGVRDLAGVVALAAGMEAPPGGDAGPASAVPTFWGLHEFDAFLLVVDGVPWGGAFNPAIPTLDFNNVERIEIVRGAAPVIYGATSFVGVIQVIHYPAGEAANEARIGIGSYGSRRVSASIALAPAGAWRQSVSASGEDLLFHDDVQRIKNGHAAYRGGGDIDGTAYRFDVEAAAERQKPASPVILQGMALTTVTPLDANYNPSDARIDEDRYHAVFGSERATAFGRWSTTVSMAYSSITDIRGFLRPDLTNDGTQNADSQHQTRTIVDDYLDSHFSLNLGGGLALLYGADLLYGLGKQTSVNGAYYAPVAPNGPLPSTTSLHVDEINSERDVRAFGGEYVQMNWQPDSSWDVVGGLRFNQTHEHLIASHTDGFDPTLDLAADHSHKGRRLGGTLGVSYRAWREGRDEAVLYANYRNAFKPAAIDFGPDYTPNLLAPETAQSWEAGLRGALNGGRFDYEAGLFLLDFKNLVVATTDDQGNAIFQNAGGEHLRGMEFESHYRFTPDLNVTTALSYHDARFTHYVAAEGGANVDASGKQLTLSPRWLGALGLVYAPAQGFNGALVVNYVGRRYLNIANTAAAAAYTTVRLDLGYRWQRYSVGVDAYNLSDRRPPVSASEFGDRSYYLLPGRTIFLNLGMMR